MPDSLGPQGRPGGVLDRLSRRRSRPVPAPFRRALASSVFREAQRPMPGPVRSLRRPLGCDRVVFLRINRSSQQRVGGAGVSVNGSRLQRARSPAGARELAAQRNLPEAVALPAFVSRSRAVALAFSVVPGWWRSHCAPLRVSATASVVEPAANTGSTLRATTRSCALTVTRARPGAETFSVMRMPCRLSAVAAFCGDTLSRTCRAVAGPP